MRIGWVGRAAGGPTGGPPTPGPGTKASDGPLLGSLGIAQLRTPGPLQSGARRGEAVVWEDSNPRGSQERVLRGDSRCRAGTGAPRPPSPARRAGRKPGAPEPPGVQPDPSPPADTASQACTVPLVGTPQSLCPATGKLYFPPFSSTMHLNGPL